jgi:DNA-binding transcriptional MerR regulator
MTPQKTEWWHQAQAAYEAGDADQLEVILTLCEIGDGGATVHTSASLLHRITAQLKSSLREIKRQIASWRRDPAWNFSHRADHAELLAQLRRELLADLERMREAWRQMQETIAHWKAAAEKLRPQVRHRRQPQSMEFPF